MIKKTILRKIKRHNYQKSTTLINLEIRESSIPIEEIFLVIDHPEIFLSMPAMNF